MDSLWFVATSGIAAIIILLGVVVMWRILRDRRSGYPSKDERTQKVTGRAATYALIITQYFTIALLLVTLISQVFYGSPAFEVGYALVASVLVSSLSFLVLQWYFSRKGDF